MGILGSIGRILGEIASDMIKEQTGIDLMKDYDSFKTDYDDYKEVRDDWKDMKENKEEYIAQLGEEEYYNQLREAEERVQSASAYVGSKLSYMPGEWAYIKESHDETFIRKYLSRLSDSQLKNMNTKNLTGLAEELYFEERDRRGI